jgi:hypothetical protein
MTHNRHPGNEEGEKSDDSFGFLLPVMSIDEGANCLAEVRRIQSAIWGEDSGAWERQSGIEVDHAEEKNPNMKRIYCGCGCRVNVVLKGRENESHYCKMKESGKVAFLDLYPDANVCPLPSIL